MAHSQFDQFLQEATCPDQESGSTLDEDSLYGLYTSWCYLSRKAPHPEHVFWAAMNQRVNPGQCLRMKDPAAADYILTSYRAVVYPPHDDHDDEQLRPAGRAPAAQRRTLVPAVRHGPAPSG